VALMTDGAGSLMRLKQMLPIRTRFVLDYFHVAMKLRHIDQCIGADSAASAVAGWVPIRTLRPLRFPARLFVDWAAR
jgi:hypothetical protein